MDKDFDYEDFKRFMNYLETDISSSDWSKPITVSLDTSYLTDDSHIIFDFHDAEYELKRIDDLEAEVSSRPTYDTVDDLMKAVKEQ